MEMNGFVCFNHGAGSCLVSKPGAGSEDTRTLDVRGFKSNEPSAALSVERVELKSHNTESLCRWSRTKVT